MAKNKIKVGGKTKGDIRVGNQKDIKNSELTESENDIELQGDFEGDIEMDNKEGFDGVKSKSSLVWIVAAIAAAAIAIAGYYFSKEEPEEVIENEYIEQVNDSI